MRKHDALTSQAITEVTSLRSESKRGSGAHPGLSDTNIYPAAKAEHVSKRLFLALFFFSKKKTLNPTLIDTCMPARPGATVACICHGPRGRSRSDMKKMHKSFIRGDLHEGGVERTPSPIPVAPPGLSTDNPAQHSPAKPIEESQCHSAHGAHSNAGRR
jgi:hypothetical protein